MQLKDQVCTLRQAKKLKELGIAQQGYFCYAASVLLSHKTFDGESIEWTTEYDDSDEAVELNAAAYAQFDGVPHYSAFTVAELGVMLPPGFISYEYSMNGKNYWTCTPEQSEDFGYEYDVSECRSEAEARASSIINLLESGEITAGEVSQRLSR